RPGRALTARAGVGRDVRPDHGGRAAAAQGGQEGRAGAPDAPEPVPPQHGRRAALVRPRARPRDEPRPAAEARPRRVPRRRRRLQPRSRRAAAGGRARRRDGGPAVSDGNGNGRLTAKEFKTDQEVRWCPGCGDYAILAAVQSFLPELGIPRERIVFISGIGCAARFPYYVETYGIHSIHGRAPAIATGLALS